MIISLLAPPIFIGNSKNILFESDTSENAIPLSNTPQIVHLSPILPKKGNAPIDPWCTLILAKNEYYQAHNLAIQLVKCEWSEENEAPNKNIVTIAPIGKAAKF